MDPRQVLNTEFPPLPAALFPSGVLVCWRCVCQECHKAKNEGPSADLRWQSSSLDPRWSYLLKEIAFACEQPPTPPWFPGGGEAYMGTSQN